MIHDPVHNPQHYTTHPSGIEAITLTKHFSFCLGSALKYIFRCDAKGEPIQDLEKAIWYLQCEVDLRRARAYDAAS